MKLPKEVNVLGVVYQIKYLDNPSEVDAEKRRSVWGQVDYWTRTIRIYKGNRPTEDIFQTILHEILHAIGDALHLKALDEGGMGTHHDDLDLIALALADILARNEWIILEE